MFVCINEKFIAFRFGAASVKDDKRLVKNGGRVYRLYLETVSVDNYDDMVSALVALKYTPGDEISLMRKGITDSENEEYAVYLAYVTACKTFAREYYGVQNVTHD